jgi:hypothetical protein
VQLGERDGAPRASMIWPWQVRGAVHVVVRRGIDLRMEHRARGWSESRPGPSPLANHLLPFEAPLTFERPALR